MELKSLAPQEIFETPPTHRKLFLGCGFSFFFPRDHVSASSTHLSAVPSCAGSVCQAPKSPSEGIIPYEAVDMLCPQKELSSGSSYTAILHSLYMSTFE